MVTVYSTSDERLADMAVGLLKNEGIPARKIFQTPASFLPFSMGGTGIIAVKVPEENSDRAKEILAARLSDDTPPDSK